MNEKDTIRECILFEGLSEEEYQRSLHFFSAKRASYKKGESLSRLGEPLAAFGLVLTGTVRVFMDDFDGQPIIMANVTEGQTFGESLCFLEMEPQIHICAATDVAVLWMKTDAIKYQNVDFTADVFKENTLRTILSNRFIKLLSQRTLSMNERVQILSKITLRDKLITFFSQMMNRCGKCNFTVSMNRSDMAAYLGSNRSALSRELSKMRDEGILTFRNNNFCLHQKP